jgi:hypothetical protein
VLACNFWLLAAEATSPHAVEAWFQVDGSTLPVVSALRQWVTSLKIVSGTTAGKSAHPPTAQPPAQTIAHYLLLPLYDWGVPDWHLDSLRPFIKQNHPTIGFSLGEAAMAARVTVVGGEQAFPDETLEALRATGCVVERIIGDGTIIAS